MFGRFHYYLIFRTDLLFTHIKNGFDLFEHSSHLIVSFRRGRKA